MSHIDDGPTKRRLLWTLLQKTFDEWGLVREERITILKTFEEVYASWETAGWISHYGSWWERAVRLIEIDYALGAMLKDKEKEDLRNWLRTPNSLKPFSSKAPLDAMLSDESKSISFLGEILSYLRKRIG